jgi:hypothetical protein
LTVRQFAAYQPYFFIQGLPVSAGLGTGFAASPDATPSVPTAFPGFSPQASLLSEPGITFDTIVSYSMPVTQRTSIEFSSNYQGSRYEEGLADIDSRSATARLTHAASRRTSLHASYSYRAASYDTQNRSPLVISRSGELVSQDVEGGLTYRRALSETRAAMLNIGSGTSIIDDDLVINEARRRRYEVTAYAGGSLQFARTWIAQGQFRRALQLLQGLSQPYFGNTVGVAVRGQLAERTDLLITARYAQGQISSVDVFRGYDSKSAGFRVRHALSSHIALSGEYMYGEYAFGRDIELPSGFIRALNRHTVQVGIGFRFAMRDRRPVAP